MTSKFNSAFNWQRSKATLFIKHTTLFISSKMTQSTRYLKGVQIQSVARTKFFYLFNTK